MPDAPSPPPLDVDALQKLWEASTPGEWRSLRDGNQYIETKYIPTAKVVGASRIDGIVRPWNPHALLAFGFQPKEYETARFLDDDADFIAAAHNAFPALLAEIRALQEENRRLRGLCDLSSQLLRTDELTSAESRLSEAAEREMKLWEMLKVSTHITTYDNSPYVKSISAWTDAEITAALASQPIQPGTDGGARVGEGGGGV